LGVTEGTAIKYTQRCIEALCANITRFVYWPDAERKAEIKAHFSRKGFGDLLGAIDGTLFPFYRVPTMDKHSWATRKGNFAMGATGVCDHQGAFIFFSTGYPGSRHDSAAYKDTDLYRFQNRYFAEDEYTVGDAAYGLSPTLMTSFKGTPSPEQIKFNKKLNGVRTKVEHGFGLLKGRFRSLSSLRVHISSSQRVHEANMHISACVVLHNILLRSGINDPFEKDRERWVQHDAAQGVTRNDDSDSDSDSDNSEELTPAQNRQRRQQALNKRLALMASVLYP
jgi:hypothetical protein